MKKLILLGLVLVMIPFVLGDEAWQFHTDNGTFLMNTSNLGDDKFCKYFTSTGLDCTYNGSTSTLTQEEVEDYVGGMLDGTETGISVTYNDAGGNIDFVVSGVGDKWTIDDDTLINVTGTLQVNESALSITESQISDLGSYVLTTGDTMTGNLSMQENSIQLNTSYWGVVSSNDDIDGESIALTMTNPPNIALPHFLVQSGGGSQASFIARSFMIVDEYPTLLSTINRTDCRSWSYYYGKELKIDCNTTTTGADLYVGDDLQVNGEVWLVDSEDEFHFMTRELSLNDELFNHIFYNDINHTYDGTFLSIEDSDNFVINLNATNFYYDYSQLDINLTSGSNSTPSLNSIVWQNYPTPSLEVLVGATPDEHFAGVGQAYVGDDGYIYGSSVGGASVENFIKNVYETEYERGALYVSGFTPTSSASDFNVSEGEMRLLLKQESVPDNFTMSDGYYFILENGTFVQADETTDITEYSNGVSIGTNKYFNVVFGVVHADGSGRLMAIVQNEPSTEYVTSSDAEVDSYDTINYFPSDVFLKRWFVPIARVVMQQGDSNLQLQTSGFYHRDIRGAISGQGGSPPSPSITDHDLLNNLDYASSGHTGFASSDETLTLRNWNVSTNTRIDNLNNYSIAELDLEYHERGENIVIGNYDLTMGGGFSSGGISMYYNGSIWLNDDIFIGGDVLSVSETSMNGTFLPSETSVYNIGSNALKWNEGYFASTLDSATLNTGQGDNELYAMNQDVESTDAVTFKNLTITEDYGTGSQLVTMVQFDNVTISANSTHFCIVGSSTLCVAN